MSSSRSRQYPGRRLWWGVGDDDGLVVLHEIDDVVREAVHALAADLWCPFEITIWGCATWPFAGESEGFLSFVSESFRETRFLVCVPDGGFVCLSPGLWVFSSWQLHEPRRSAIIW